MSARRRRPSDDDREGLPLLPLVVIVILAGLLLGGSLAHFFGAPKNEKAGTALTVAALPSASLAPVATMTPVPNATTTPAPITTVTPAPAHTTSPAPTVTPLGMPSPLHSTTPAPPLSARPALKEPTRASGAAELAATRETASPPPAAPAAKEPAAAPSAAVKTVTQSAPAKAATQSTPAAKVAYAPPPATHDDRPTAVVRSYLVALERGDRSAAASYLSHGFPSETFMGSDARIESIRSANVGAQQYRVTADVQTASGEYYVTFTVEQGPVGLQITDHYSIKPQ